MHVANPAVCSAQDLPSDTRITTHAWREQKLNVNHAGSCRSSQVPHVYMIHREMHNCDRDHAFHMRQKVCRPCRAASSGKKWRYGTTLIAAATINRQARAATGKAPLLVLVVCHQKLPDPAFRKYSLDPLYKTKSKSSTEQASIRCKNSCGRYRQHPSAVALTTQVAGNPGNTVTLDGMDSSPL